MKLFLSSVILFALSVATAATYSSVKPTANSHVKRLRVDLEDVPGNTAFAEYSSFAVGSETEKYKLRVGGFSGTGFLGSVEL